MNETPHPDSVSDRRWPHDDHRAAVPDTPMLSSSETTPPAAQKPGDSVAAAGLTLHAKTEQWRETRDEWVEGMRSTVRSKPLLALAAALALGTVTAMIAQTTRITRTTR